jgi:protein SCO1/2
MTAPIPTGNPKVAPTVTACLAVLTGFAIALYALTGGLEHWTFEEMRRVRAIEGKIQAHALQVRTPQGTAHFLGSTPADTAGVTLLHFIYTSCPTVCQALGSEYTQMQQALAAQGVAGSRRIQLVSLSFDIEHDSVARLDAYARLHHADSRVWTVAAPTRQADLARLLHDLGVVVVPDTWGGYVHNGSIHVIDGAGRVRAIYDDADWQQALAFATRLTGSTR